MLNKKVRSGHLGWVTKVLDEVDECRQNEYTIARKRELLKWKVSIKEQLEKILLLDDLILVELALEIEQSGQFKADAMQRLAAVEERTD